MAEEAFKLVRYTGGTFRVSSTKGKPVTVRKGDVLGYKKPKLLYHFMVNDAKFSLNDRNAQLVLEQCEPIQKDAGFSQADFVKHIRSYVSNQMRVLSQPFASRWDQDGRKWRWQKKNPDTIWYNMPMKVLAGDEFEVTVRIILVKTQIYLLILFPEHIRNPRFKINQPVFKDLTDMFRLLVTRTNARFRTKASINLNFDYILDPTLRRITDEQKILPAWISTSPFKEDV